MHPPPPTLRQAWIAVSAVYFAYGVGLGLWAAHIPLVKAGLGLSASEMGIALLGMAAGAITVMPLMGWVIGLFGSRRCTVVAGTAFVLLVTLPLIAPSWPLLIASTLVLGAANGGVDVAMSTQGTVIEKAMGRPIMSSVNGFFSLGGVVGAGVASLILSLDLAPAARTLLATVPLAVLVLATGFWLLRRDPPQEGGHGLRLPSGPALLLGGLALLSVLAEWATLDWSAIFLTSELGAPAHVGAWGFGAFCVAMMIGRFTGDEVVRRLGGARVLTLSGLLSTVGTLVFALAPSVPVALFGFALTGFGLANLFPVLISAASRLPGIPAGQGVAMVASFAYAGGLVGPVLIGFGTDLVGIRLALGSLVLAGVALGIAGLAGALPGVARPARAAG
ncbi:MAG: MFS transporter [Geminicoccaceae bacterium]